MRALAVLSALALSACMAGTGGEVVERTSRELARGAVDAAAAEYLPGVDVSPFTDCVIDNASTAELIDLARAAAVPGGAAQAWPVVETVAARPETTRCLAGRLDAGELLTLGSVLL